MWEQMSVKHRAIGLGYEFFSKISDYVDPARDELPKLSRRERECLSLAAKGMTLDGIGDQLGIARSTVRYHLENSILKLDVENRAQAISKAIALRILDPVQQPRDRALK
jgi:DNA-binding CsgD family transcriptional regulator